MRVFHQPDIDYVSIDFSNQVEAKSYFEHGIIVRLDSGGHVIGLDITDSSAFFLGREEIGMKEACRILGISESTMRRRIKKGLIKYRKPNNKDYRFKRKDILSVA